MGKNFKLATEEPAENPLKGKGNDSLATHS